MDDKSRPVAYTESMSLIAEFFSEYQDLMDSIAPQPATRPPAFSDSLDASSRQDLQFLLELSRDGQFPKLWDFFPEFGRDVSGFPNMDPGVYALANDGAGNFFVLYPDGYVDIWCHDESGYMEGREFESLRDVFECVVLVMLAKSRRVSWAELATRFEEKSMESEGWAFFMDDVMEYLELV